MRRGVSTYGELGVFSAISVIKMAIDTGRYMVVAITHDGMESKFFIPGNVVMFIQPEFADFPSRKAEFRSANRSIIKPLSQIPRHGNFDIVPFDGESGDLAVIQAAMEWRRGLKNIPGDHSKLRMKSVTAEQWSVIYNAYGH